MVNESFFKAGWRPGSGWVCVVGLAYQLVFWPILNWLSVNAFHWNPPPRLDAESVMSLLVPLLGLGAYRSYEKTRVNR